MGVCISGEQRAFQDCVRGLSDKKRDVKWVVEQVNAGAIKPEWFKPEAGVRHNLIVAAILAMVKKDDCGYINFANFSAKFMFLRGWFHLDKNVLIGTGGFFDITTWAINNCGTGTLRDLASLGVPRRHVCELLIDGITDESSYIKTIVDIFRIDTDNTLAEERLAIGMLRGVTDCTPTKFDLRIAKYMMRHDIHSGVRYVIDRQPDATKKQFTLDVVIMAVATQIGFAMELIERYKLPNSDIEESLKNSNADPAIIHNLRQWLALRGNNESAGDSAPSSC